MWGKVGKNVAQNIFIEISYVIFVILLMGQSHTHRIKLKKLALSILTAETDIYYEDNQLMNSLFITEKQQRFGIFFC